MRRQLLFVLLFAFAMLAGPVLAPRASAAPGAEVVVRLTSDAYALADIELEEVMQGHIVTRLPELESLSIRLTTDESTTEAIIRLQRLPWILMAEGNPSVRTTVAPNDPLYSTQAPYLTLIEAPEAWDIETGRD